ncbi:hypothetical protein [Xenorhabdus bharatensis]|uniref:hypothetical protein n=1 Tax=Xenorhabdus bharatensis TaxID=3136256 RepID=UPI0030F41E27
MIKVTLLYFSGRENFSWDYYFQNYTKKLISLFVENKNGINLSKHDEKLGFSGFLVEFSYPESQWVAEYNLPDKFYICDGSAPNLEESKHIALELIKGFTESPELRERVIQDINQMTSQSEQFDADDGHLPDEKNPDEKNKESPYLQAAEKTSHDTDDKHIVTTDFLSRKKGRVHPVQAGPYNPAFWNDTSVMLRNNCYAYACNLATGSFPQPGRKAGVYYSCRQSSVMDAARADGLIDLDRYPFKEANLHKPNYVVALVTTPDAPDGNCLLSLWDYHWYRLVLGDSKDGRTPQLWAHKPGHNDVRNKDNEGHTIYDLCRAKHGIYTKFAGYFIVNNQVSIR